jgi:uncharacterized protein
MRRCGTFDRPVQGFSGGRCGSKRRHCTSVKSPRLTPSIWSHSIETSAVCRDRLVAALRGRPVAALLANAGRGLGHGFLDQDFAAVRHVIDTNITGTLRLIQQVGRGMRDRGQGRILITGSIAGFSPGTYQAAYNASKAFLDSFSFALRHEVKDRGITVTCLMPGATETEFFERADMLDTKIGQSKKDDPVKVAETGYKAMMRGDGDVVTGWHNKLQTAIASITPAGMLAEQHRKMAEPGSGKEASPDR